MKAQPFSQNGARNAAPRKPANDTSRSAAPSAAPAQGAPDNAADNAAGDAGAEWTPFPGGELEGKRPKVLCPACRERFKTTPPEGIGQRPLCFQCYRAGLERDRAIVAAGNLDTASEARFQHVLPLEPVNRPRLDRLRMERAAARARARMGAGRFVDRRRHAQIEARHVLQQIGIGLKTRQQREQAGMTALHAAELQLPEAWLPFVAAK